jgi:hypothetical protein
VKTKTIKITGCSGCPNVKKEYTGKGNHSFLCVHSKMMRTVSWPGTKYPDERRGTMIVEECERPSEYPDEGFPEWCPL